MKIVGLWNENMINFFNKLLGKCPNCNKKIPVSDYSPKNAEITAVCYWEHFKRINNKRKNTSVKYCKECYEELKRKETSYYKIPSGLLSENKWKCNICGKSTLQYPWYHIKMYLEKNIPPEERTFYIVLVCDNCFETLGEKEVTKKCQKGGFI